MSKAKTVRITFKQEDGSARRMLFGNSYKTWDEQAVEYIYRTFGNPEHGWRFSDVAHLLDSIKIEQSDDPWKSWGGLKWCDEASFQEQLNREGVQKNEPDNPNARQYSEFVFYPYPYGMNRLAKSLRGW